MEGCLFKVGLAVLAGQGWNTGLSSWFLCGLVFPKPTLPPAPMSHRCLLKEAERQRGLPSCYSCCSAESARPSTQEQRELHLGLVMPSEMAAPGKEGRDLPSEDDMPRDCHFLLSSAERTTVKGAVEL